MDRVPTEVLIVGLSAGVAFMGVGTLVGKAAERRGHPPDRAASIGTSTGISAALIAAMLGALAWRAATGTL